MHPHHAGTVTGKLMRMAGTEMKANGMTEKEADTPGTEIGTGNTAERTRETSAALTHSLLEGANPQTIQSVQHRFSSGAADSHALRKAALCGVRGQRPDDLHCLSGTRCRSKMSRDVVLLVWHACTEGQLKWRL